MENLIKQIVEQSKNFPNPIIEYNFDLPEGNKEISADNFYGVKALYNQNVEKGKGVITYKLN